FFFSSRRRHTRFSRDWSSDVCSSDLLRAFRDETDLTADPGLWAVITGALRTADNFVLLASPGAASSRWVNDEIRYWLDELKRPADRKRVVQGKSGDIAAKGLSDRNIL